MAFSDEELRNLAQSPLTSNDKLPAVSVYAAERDPVKHADDMRKADQLGVPVSDLPDVEDLARKRVNEKAFADLPSKAPATTRWVTSHPDNAALISDSLELSAKLEAATRKEQEQAARPISEKAADLATGVWVGVGGYLPQTAEGLIGAERMFAELFVDPTAKALQRALGLPEFAIGEALKPGQQRYKKLTEELGQVATEKMVSGGMPEEIAPGVVSGLQMIGQVVQAIAAPESVLPTMAGVTAGSAYGQAREKGISPIRAAGFAAGQGAIEYGTEKMVWNKFLKAVEQGNPLTKAAIGMAFREIPGEQVATFFQDLNEAAVLTPEKPMSEFWAERPNAALQTLIATVVGGGGMVAVSAAVDTLSKRLVPVVSELEKARGENVKSTAAATKGESDYARLKTVMDIANEHPLRERHDAKFKEFVSELMQESDLAEVYVDAAALNEVLKQSNVDLNELKTKMPAVAVQLQEGLATNGIVNIPTADLVTYVTDPALQAAILPHLKTTPDGLNYNESQSFFQTQVQELEKKAIELADAAQPLLTREEFNQQQVSEGETPDVLQKRADDRVAELTKVAAPTPEQTQELDFLTANREVPEALAKHFDVALQTAPVPTYEQYLESRKDQASVRAREVETLRKDIIEGIRATGAYNESATHALAVPLVSLYQVKSAEMGLAPSELMKQIPLKFVVDQMTFAKRQQDAASILAQQVDQTQTEAFKKWFGDSKVVDAEGNPLVVYHSTSADFNTFEVGRPTKNATIFGSYDAVRAGLFFAENPTFASEYGPRRMDVFLSIEDPADLTAPSDAFLNTLDANGYNSRMLTSGQHQLWELFDEEYDGGFLVETLKKMGYDGAIIEELDDQRNPQKVWVAFEPTQIKSAIGNVGTFDPKNLNILFQLAQQVEEGKLPEGPLSAQDTKDLRRLWEMYAMSEGEVAQYGTSDAKAEDPKDAASAIGNLQETTDAVYANFPDMKPTLKDVTQQAEGAMFKDGKGYAIEFSHKAEGKTRTGRAIVDTVDRTIQLDVSKWGEGGRGAAVYKVLLDFAHNNGFKFIGDTAGISVAGIKRRLENMLSHALQTNDVSYMALHPDQVKFIEKETGVKIQWFANDAEKTIEQMLNASYNLAIKDTPEIKNVYFDFAKRLFVDSRTGRTDRSIDRLVSPSTGKPDLLARKGKAGRTTLARTALSSTVLRAPEESRHLVLREIAQFSMAGLPGAERLLYQQEVGQPAFYSQLARALSDAPDRVFSTGKATAQWLQSNTPKLGVKKDELFWTGITDWLNTQGKVTKADVLAYLAGNGVQVQDVMLGDKDSAVEEELTRVEQEYQDAEAEVANARYAAHGPRWADEPSIGQVASANIPGWVTDIANGVRATESMNKLNALNLPTERKQLMLEYGKALARKNELFDKRKKLSERLKTGDVKFASYVLPGGENYRELLLTLPEKEPRGLNEIAQELYGKRFSELDDEEANRVAGQELREKKAQNFRSAHFDQPNILAHVRFNERTDAEGKRVLFIEEVQSDWGQKGKKEGFAGEEQARKESFSKERFDKPYAELTATQQRAVDASIPAGIPSAPFVTDTKSWTALALKRMIAYAAENGFDSIAWTTGEQQAERYDLSKQIGVVAYRPANNTLRAYDTKGNRVIHETVKPEDVEEYIGKEAAKKLLEAPTDSFGEQELKGEGLKVGGEGMKGYYDGILPQVANDILKKLGGKVGRFGVSMGDDVGAAKWTVQFADGEVHNSSWTDKRVAEQIANKAAGDKVIPAGETGSKQPGFTITDEMRAKVQAEGLPLFQGNKLAYFDPEQMMIAMMKGANLSSMIHETGHFYLEALRILSAHPNATQQMKDDFAKTLKWFDIPDRATWEGMSLEQKRPYHEQWAQSYERWTLEGKSPTVEMQPIFARFRAWMLSVYKSLEQFLAQNPQAGKLNDEVRGVFARLIASEDAIKQAERVHAYSALMQGEGVSDADYAKYMELGDEATQDAITEMQKRSLRDMKWLSNAKNKALRKLQQEAAAARRIIREEVTKEVMSEPVNQLRTFLTKGETTDPATGDAIKVTAGYKLNSAEVKELYPETMLARPDLTKLRGMTSPDGLPLDLLAQQFGFTSGDAMVRELTVAEVAKDKIDGVTDQRMLEQHGELIDAQSVEQAANAAVHNEARARFLATGLTMLTKSPLPARELAKAAKEAADNTIARKKVRELRPKQYSAAEARENKKAIALAAKSPAEAADAQRAALLNNRLAAAASDALDEVSKAQRLFEKFQSEGVRKSLDLEYLEQIDDLLRGLDTRKGQSLKAIDKRRDFTAFIARQEDLGFEPILDAAQLEVLARKHYKDMTVEELRGLVDSIKNIEHLGRLKKKLLTAKDAREFAERIAEAAQSIEANANRKVVERASPSDIASRLAYMARGFAAEHRKAASLVREMDGNQDGGVMWDMFIRPMNEAGDLETEMRAEAATKVSELFAGIKDKMGGIKEHIKATRTQVPGTKLSMTYEERVMFAMNWGNLGNRQRLLDGGISGNRAITEGDAQAVLDTLDKADWDFVQQTWDYLDTFRAAVAAQERRLTGKEPKWIDPAPVQTKFGTYRGGYFPAKYDAELSTRSESLEAATNLRMGMKGAFGAAATRNGYTQKRSEEVKNRPLALTFSVVSQHVNEVVHRVAWQDWLVDANRMLRSLDGPIRDNYGPEVLRELKRLVEDSAAGDAPAATTVERAINHIRVGSTIVGMGWRVTTALLQPSGLAQSWVRVGGKWTAIGVKQYLANPMATSEMVNQKSKLMRDRGRTMQREINEILNTIRVGSKVSNVQASYFWLIAKMQRTVDVPTWLGAYEKAIAQLEIEKTGTAAEREAVESKAIAMADQAVIDSQSGGQLKDLARVQRGSPIYKLFTNFYSYFSATYNLNVEAYRRTSFKDPVQVGRFAVDLLILNTIPVLFSVALRELLKGGCDNDDLQCLAKEVGKEQLNYMFGQMILLREAGAAAGAITGDSFGYSGPAGLRFFSDLYKAGQQIGQGEADFAAWKATTNTLGALTHLPIGQVNSTLEGIMEIEKGNVEGVGILPAVLAGKERKAE